MEEESLWGTIVSEEKSFRQGVASHKVYAGAPVMAYCLVERENCDERLSFFADPKVENEVSDEKKG